MSTFQFKEFAVEQRQSPAKITTDATVFASSLELQPCVKKVLEIGTGTGVLSLMIAQKAPAVEIDALEINPVSFNEAQANFRNSKWSSNLNCILGDFKHFNSVYQYDLIFSNPPFFNNNLQSEINPGKNTAYHTKDLSFKDLANGIDKNLLQEGEAHIMLPPFEMSLFEKEMAALGLYPTKSGLLRHQPNTKIIRVFSLFSRGAGEDDSVKKEIIVRDENNNFHPSYIDLMKDFLTIF